MTEIVLMIRDADQLLLKSAPGVTLTILDYDAADDLLQYDDGDRSQIVEDATGTPYLTHSPAPNCALCGDWIGDDEPRVSLGEAHGAASFCMVCAREQALGGDTRLDFEAQIRANAAAQEQAKAHLAALVAEAEKLTQALLAVRSAEIDATG